MSAQVRRDAQKNVLSSYCIRVVLLSVMVFSGCCTWTRNEVEDSKKIGDELILGLREYREAEGVYPESLELLAPEYLDRIRQPTAGTRRWSYRAVDDGHEFVLCFEAEGGYPSCMYSSTEADLGWWEDN